jgi:hypothetical protein
MKTMADQTPNLELEERPPHRHRRWPWVVGVLVAIVAIPFAVLGILFAWREHPGAKPLSEAVESYRQGESAPSSVPGVTRVAAGVYSAAGSGHEAISFPSLSQDDGAALPLTVQYEDDDCWVVRIDYNQAHWQTWRYCRGDTAGSVLEHGGQTYQRWDLGATQIVNTSTFVCDPPVVAIMPDAASGTTWPASCRGTNTQVSGTTTSAGPYTLIGEEDLLIAGTSVPAQHYRQDRTVSGAQSGDELNDVWFVKGSGLPVRSERSLRLESSSPLGTITYTETGWWQLTSLEPNT